MNPPDNIHDMPVPHPGGDYEAQAPVPGFRTLPHSVEAERGLLGAVLLDNRAMDMLEGMRPEHFAIGVHASIFEAMSTMIERNQVVNPVTIEQRLDATLFEGLGTPIQYITALAAGAVSIINAGEYGRIVREACTRRELIGAAQTAIVSAHDDRNASSMDLIEATARDLDHIVDGGVRGAARCLREMAQAAGDEIDATWRAGGGLSGLGTSFSEIDRITRGLRPGNLVILAARPAMGKTTLAVNISHKLALEDCPTGFFSMEMTGDELITRMAVST